MRKAGYSTEDQLYIAKAYELSMALFTGQFRGTGKTFTAHLVGTASILVSLQMPLPLIAAALLHAVYLQGDFGHFMKQSHRTLSRQLDAIAQDVKIERFKDGWNGISKKTAS